MPLDQGCLAEAGVALVAPLFAERLEVAPTQGLKAIAKRSSYPRLWRRGGWQRIIQLPQEAGIGLGVNSPKPCSLNPVLQALGSGAGFGRYARALGVRPGW